MDKWDSEESSKNKSILGSKKSILILVCIMVAMWVVIGGLSYYTPPSNCNDIEQFVNSNEFYSFPDSDTKQQYINAYNECARDNIIVK